MVMRGTTRKSGIVEIVEEEGTRSADDTVITTTTTDKTAANPRSCLVVLVDDEHKDNNNNINNVKSMSKSSSKEDSTTIPKGLVVVPTVDNNSSNKNSKNDDDSVVVDLTPVHTLYFSKSKTATITYQPLQELEPLLSKKEDNKSSKDIVSINENTTTKSDVTLAHNEKQTKDTKDTTNCFPSLASRFTSILLLVEMHQPTTATTNSDRNSLFEKFVVSLQTQWEYNHIWSILIDSIIASSSSSSDTKREEYCCSSKKVKQSTRRNMIELATHILQHYYHYSMDEGCFLGVKTLHNYYTRISTEVNDSNTTTTTSYSPSGRKNKILSTIILLLQESCNLRQPKGDFNNNEAKTDIRHQYFFVHLFTHFFNHLVRIMDVSSSNLNGTSRRTVLSVMAMDAALLLLDRLSMVVLQTTDFSYASSYTLSNAPHMVILDHLSDILKFIRIRKHWCHSTDKTSNESCWYNDDDKYTKQECLIAVLSDFETILHTAQRQYEECGCYYPQCNLHQRLELDDEAHPFHQQQEQQGLWNDQTRTISQHLCWHLRGAPIVSGSEHDSIHYLFGGMYQCLSSNSLNKNTFSLESFVNSLCWASTITYSSTSSLPSNYKIDNKKTSVEMELETQRCVVRSFTAWLASSSSRSLSNSFQANDALLPTNEHVSPIKRDRNIVSRNQFQQSLEALMMLLTSGNGNCIHLALVSLNRLWAVANKLDSLTAATSDLFSVDVLFELLKGQGEVDEEKLTSALDPFSMAACMMIVRLAMANPKDILPKVMSESLPISTKIKILIGLAGANNHSGLHVSTGNKEYISNFVAKELLTFLGHSYMQTRCRDPVFSFIQPRNVVPGLLDALSCNGLGSIVASSAASWICQLLTSSLDASQVVDILVEILCKFETNEGSEGKSLERCIAYAPMWRRSLQSECVPSDRFAAVIEALIKSMFRMPSMVAPLLLFGELLGDGSDHIVNGKGRVDQTNCVLEKAVMVIIEQGLNELERTSSLSSDNKREDEILYEKLSPILMLRRVPYKYFRLLHILLFDTCNNNVSLSVWKLGKELMCRLDIKQESTKSNVPSKTSNADEKRLCAELIGRILPLYVRQEDDKFLECTHKVNSFEWLFIPSFSRMMRLMASQGAHIEDSHLEKHREDLIRDTTRDCRTALFVACHHVRLVDDASSGAALLATVAFAVNVVSFDPVHIIDSEDNLGFDKLQTGCMDFLAFCLESWADRCLSASVFIEEMESDHLDSLKAEVFGCKKWCSNVLDTLKYILDVVLRISLTGSPPRSWQDVDRWFYDLLDGQFLPLDSKRVVNVSARVCCINAISLASQRRPDEDETLQKMVTRIMPSFISWGRHHLIRKSDTNHIYHPLCIAAVQQAAFIFIMKSKSLECCAIPWKPFSLKEEVNFLLKWALETVRGGHQFSGLGVEELRQSFKAMRISGLKLLGAIITVDQLTTNSPDVNRYHKRLIELQNLGDAVAFLNGVCNIEQDKDIQKLADHFIRGLT